MGAVSGVPAETFNSSAGKFSVPLQSRIVSEARGQFCNQRKYHNGAIHSKAAGTLAFTAVSPFATLAAYEAHGRNASRPRGSGAASLRIHREPRQSLAQTFSPRPFG